MSTMPTRKPQRLFFALWPDERVRRELGCVVRELPRHGGRLPHQEDIHLTLAFLGMVEPEKIGCIEQAADTVRAVPFELVIDRVGYWKHPRILWCGPSAVPPALTRLVGDMVPLLEICGFKPDERPYSPHITLARKARKIDPYVLDTPIKWPVGEFALVGSDPGGGVPHYRVLKKWSMDS